MRFCYLKCSFRPDFSDIVLSPAGESNLKFKRIEMLGFKSFVDKTVLEFSGDLTAIVGPNGCGKSNVSDAIRWVLGEHRPKNLRAKKMEDVIFNGSADRKPLGMAEVSLTISELNGIVTHPEFKDFDELVVTRRLYRSGESEYLVNKNLCRLKDIVDIFLDTGVSLDTFSIIEQGRIEGLVNAKPMDRRLFIEEAAGIMKYKSRRNEAIRKLDLAQANLLRVADVLNEKEARLKTLRRQARKATFHKEYQKEIVELEIRIAALNLLRLDTELEPAEREFSKCEELNQGHSAAFSAREAEREKCRIEVAERSENLAETRRRAVEVEGYLQRLENRLEMLSSRLAELDEEDRRRREEIESLLDESRKLKEKQEQLTTQEVSLSRALDEARGEYEISAEKINNLRSELASRETEEGESRKLLARETDALSGVRQRIASGDSRREVILESIERLEAELAEAVRLGDELKVEKESLDSSLKVATSEVESSKEQMGVVSGDKSRIEALLRECEVNSVASKEALFESRSSLQVLDSLENNDSDKFADEKAFREVGVEVRGVLSDILIVEQRYEKAIEAALGANLKGVVVSDLDNAVSGIKRLVSSGHSARGLALPSIPRRVSSPVIPKLSGVEGGALDVVSFPDDYRSLMETLLAGVGISHNLDSALEAWRTGPDGITWVTLSGEVVHPSGTIEGGGAPDAKSGPLEWKRQREEIQLSVSGQEVRLRDSSERERRYREELQQVEGKVERAAQNLRHAELAFVKSQGAHRASGEKNTVSNARCIALTEQSSRFREELVHIENEHREAESEASRASASLESASFRSAEIEKKIVCVGELVARLEKEVSDRRVVLSEAQGKVAGIKNEIHRIGDAIEQNAARLARRRDEEDGSSKKRESLNLNLGQSHDEIERLKGERAEVEVEQGASSRLVEEARAQDEDLAEILRGMRGEAVRIQANLSEAAERRTTLRVQRETLTESARNEFNLDLVVSAQENKEFFPDYQEHVNRHEMLQQRLSRMGEVNPLAAQEFDEINQEYSFLKEQEEDLDASIQDLHTTIDKLNLTTKKRFLEAFEQVSAHFTDIFGRLFLGGEARMYLLDPNDPLETGVDIEVRPPGKRPGNIMLLSAGEKALTALALLFSVFSVRPSPFCLLDEVDATLDDANVGRFRDVVKELEDKSQFILITHNKRTMSYASQLYGVTQREKGVSIIVSVKMNKQNEDKESSAEEGAEGEAVAAAVGAEEA